jgi:starch synthase
MQVYFLDNEDFFKRKFIFADEDGQPFEDNPDRMAFFCKGVIETVKKFGWPPDIIHCHGWMTSLIPMYLKTAYKAEPLFQHSKVVYSVYNEEVGTSFTEQFMAKATINNLTEEDLSAYQNGAGVTLHKGAITFSDAIVKGSETLSDSVLKTIEESGKPTMEHPAENYGKTYIEFFHNLLAEEEVSE